MKSLFLFFILLQTIFAKDFSVIINKPFNDALFDITQNYNRTISAIGYTKDHRSNKKTKTTYTNPYDFLAQQNGYVGKQIELVNLNLNGKILLEKTIPLEVFNQAVSILKTPEDGYLVGGYTQTGKMLIRKLDNKANVLFTKEFGTKNYNKMSKLVLLEDGSILAVGSSYTSRDSYDPIFSTGLGGSDIFVTKFSKDGYLLWSKKYGTKYDDTGIDAVETNNGSIMLIAQTKYDNKSYMTILHLTENGDKIWLKEYDSEEKTTPHRIIKTRDGNFIILLSQINALEKSQAKLFKIDMYKNIIIQRNIQTTYSTILTDIKEFSNGEFMAVGSVEDGINTDGLAMLLNRRLTMLTQEHFGGEKFDAFYALHILNNSKVVVAGIYTNNGSQESNMWITMLNKNCTMVKLTQTNKKLQTTKHYNLKTDNSLYKKLTTVFSKEIKKGTIKIDKNLTIILLDPRLYFDVGKYKLTKTQKIFLNKFSKKLIATLKEYESKIKFLEINGFTSSEWGRKDSFTSSYIKNAKLSLLRAYSTQTYIFKIQNQQTKKWLYEMLKGSGYSFGQTITHKGKEDKIHSRRVSFQIILK